MGVLGHPAQRWFLYVPALAAMATGACNSPLYITHIILLAQRSLCFAVEYPAVLTPTPSPPFAHEFHAWGRKCLSKIQWSGLNGLPWHIDCDTATFVTNFPDKHLPCCAERERGGGEGHIGLTGRLWCGDIICLEIWREKRQPSFSLCSLWRCLWPWQQHYMLTGRGVRPPHSPPCKGSSSQVLSHWSPLRI